MLAVCKDFWNMVSLNPQMNTSHVGFSQVSSFVLTEWALSTPSPDWLTASDWLSGVPHVGVFRQTPQRNFWRCTFCKRGLFTPHKCLWLWPLSNSPWDSNPKYCFCRIHMCTVFTWLHVWRMCNCIDCKLSTLLLHKLSPTFLSISSSPVCQSSMHKSLRFCSRANCRACIVVKWGGPVLELGPPFLLCIRTYCKNKEQARKSSEDAQAAGYNHFEKVWAG